MKLDHVTLMTDDLHRMLTFYAAVPGAKVRRPTAAGYTEIGIGESVVGLFDRRSLGRALGVDLPQGSGGTAILQILVDDVDTVAAGLEAAGVALTLAPTDLPWGSRSTYVIDPDGNLMEFYRW